MLVVENLSVRFRQHDGAHLAPIRDVSFTLPRGELTGLVGGSGAGKSLIAEALIGNLPHNAEITGRMEFDGARLKHGTLALAPQSRDALDPLSPVGRQVARFAKLAGRDCNVATLFSHLGLPPANLKLWPHELSGGMAKRVLLATALATGADCIIADEPTAGLDGEAADRIMALLGSLASDGKAVLVISHDLTRLAQIARQMVILKDGRQVDVTDTEAFHTGALTHPFTKALWQAQTWEDFALPPREGNTMLSAEGLFHRFGDAVILDQASIAVEATARIGIAGPSGVGKTTLGRILAGQLRPQAGHVSWDGADIAALKGPSPVQLAPQSPELAVDPRWSIADVLENGGAIDDTILEGLGIRPEWHGRRARELSGGELARVSLARLILPTTRLLICDEITAQLDAISARQIWQALLAVLTERHIGLVVISHDDRLRKAVCTKSFQLQGGQLQPDVCFDRTEARDGASSSGGMAGRG